ncbi:type II toxin-antitoxin system RatA family toxin [Streptomyces sp. NPDC127068]|uniref:type II toxin-antitoxin system RatA family toxin n=1 Tax=Streptomyces sp. NPDC127068 TaxID=3347127 RepID=UPI0036552A32
MRSVELALRSHRTDPGTAYRRITDFGRYPDLVEEIRSVRVRPGDHEAESTSEWEIHFRNGPLRWTEIDRLDAGRRQIVFEQTEGDFEVFHGSWRVDPAGDNGCEVAFEAAFDFGIPSLAGILEPLAARVLTEAVGVIVVRLLGDATVLDDPATGAVVHTRCADTAPSQSTPAG